ncbi:MAG TPA: hypothetical protein DGB85_11790 [Deltaproteobacteria bacterium]|nr:hypothetical protein [Deltaproteobacteria bacterium]
MDRSELERAKCLRVILDLEINFYPNIDCAFCATQSIPVLIPSSVFFLAVAEIGLAIDYQLLVMFFSFTLFSSKILNTFWKSEWRLYCST